MKFFNFWTVAWDDSFDVIYENKHVTPYAFYTIDGCGHNIGYTCREQDQHAKCIICGWVSEIKTKLDDDVTYFILAVLDS